MCHTLIRPTVFASEFCCAAHAALELTTQPTLTVKLRLSRRSLQALGLQVQDSGRLAALPTVAQVDSATGAVSTVVSNAKEEDLNSQNTQEARLREGNQHSGILKGTKALCVLVHGLQGPTTDGTHNDP